MMHKGQREITKKVLKAELPFLQSARHLMLIDICIKICEYSLSGFQIIELTLFVTDRRSGLDKDLDQWVFHPILFNLMSTLLRI